MVKTILSFNLNPRNIEGIIRVHAPVFEEDDHSPELLFERWKLYTRGIEGYSQGTILFFSLHLPNIINFFN